MPPATPSEIVENAPVGPLIASPAMLSLPTSWSGPNVSPPSVERRAKTPSVGDGPKPPQQRRETTIDAPPPTRTRGPSESVLFSGSPPPGAKRLFTSQLVPPGGTLQ